MEARLLTPQEKRAELDNLGILIRSQYGPYDYKIETSGINLDSLLAHYYSLSEQSSNLEFFYLVNRFVAEFKDSHFNSVLNSNHVSTLGFIADRIESKALIDEIDRRILPETIFPFQKGDEIVSMGRRNVTDVISELGAHLGSGYNETRLRAATVLLGYRPSSRVPPQMGATPVSVRRGSSTIIDTVEVPWIQLGDPIEDMPVNRKTTASINYLDLSNRDFFEGFPSTERTFRCSGKTRISIPSDSTVLISDPFVAYYHPTPKGSVGYLRIPHYYWQPPLTKEVEYDLRFKQYEWVLYLMEKNTVGLVIDQDHNCGGSVDFLQKMVGLFAERPFLGLQFRFLASRHEYFLFKTWLTEEALHTIEGMQFNAVLDLIRKSWVSGERMTPLTTFESGKLLDPNPIRYTKPIVMLIDELSGSGGDAFPAMMQGLGRAVLFGNRTMGAGGHVLEMGALPYSGNNLRMTKSMFFRPDGTAVENNGVVPDYSYVTTRDDFIYGYRNYQAAYLEKLLSLVP